MTKNYLRFILFILIALFITGCLPQIDYDGRKPEGTAPQWLADGFDFPVGDQDGKGWGVTGYKFLDWSVTSGTFHPGEDWNIPGVGNADQGESVYAIANGEVVFSGWNTALGNVILIKHALSNSEFVWSQYAHLDRRDVQKGEIVGRRQLIGTVGRGPNNRFTAHLHFEIRKEDLPENAWPKTNGIAWDSAKVKKFWLHPSTFIKQNRPS